MAARCTRTVKMLRTNNIASNDLNDSTWWRIFCHSKSIFLISFFHSLSIQLISPICLPARLSAHDISFHFSLFYNFQRNNSNPNVVIESLSAITISEVRSDSSGFFAIHLRTLHNCQLMSTHWLILHSTHSRGKEKKFNCCIQFHVIWQLSHVAFTCLPTDWVSSLHTR